MSSALSMRLILVAVCSLALMSPGAGQDIDGPAPLDPQYVAYLDAVAAGTWRNVTPLGHSLGDIPPPTNVPDMVPPPDRVFDALPSSFDWRGTPNKVPAVGNQSSCTVCWVFAVYGSLETCSRPSDTLDCSEDHMKNNHGFDPTGADPWCCKGGNAKKAAAYLARWDGPVSEGDDPYEPGDCTSEGSTVQRHIQEMWQLPFDTNTAKQAVHDYGGVKVSFYYDRSYFSYTYNSYCYPTEAGTNHAVCIIGWDDNFSRNNFVDPPDGDGAWLTRNSWGTSWGDNGYFWLSYHDASLARSWVFPTYEPTANLAYKYEYDPYGWTTSYGSTGSQAYRWGANIFENADIVAAGQQQLEAVSFYSTVPDTNYLLRVYRDCKANDPDSGTQAHESTGSFAFAGYHTVSLATPVDILASDERFSVVLRLDPGPYQLAIEGPNWNGAISATASAGESFYSSNGHSWTDMTSIDSNTNVCIKAFTYAGPLAVRVTGLAARPGPGQIRVSWEAGTEA